MLADVCRVLEIANSRDAAARLDDDEKDVVTTDTPGGAQDVTIINESGLYSLILTSRKPAPILERGRIPFSALGLSSRGRLRWAIIQMIKRVYSYLRKIKRWWDGDYIPFENDPDSNVSVFGFWRRRPWIATATENTIEWVGNHGWEILSLVIGVAGLVLTYMQLR